MIHQVNRYKTQLGMLARCVAATLALGCALTTPAQAQDAKTIASTVCVACHGEDGNSVVPMFPKIAGLQESYIVKQLRDFQAGRRKSDIMAPVVAALKPEDFLALGTYFAGQKMKAGDSEEKKLADVGKLIFFDGNEDSGLPACIGCHQPNGAGHLIYPRIGGQHATYVTQQLKNFAASERSNDASRFMRVVAKRMTEEEINAVAAYLAGLGAK
jgi:cytochrome c553